jgi:hypothetical protein
MTKVLVYEVEIKGVKTAVNSQEDLAKAIRDTTKARQAEKFNTDEYKRLGNQIAALKTIQQEQRQEERNAINQFKQNADQGKNSYRALNAELVRLRNSYKDLTAEERQGAFGTRTIKRIQELDQELKDIDASLGQFQRNVGNYGQAFQGVFTQLSGFDIAAFASIPGAAAEIGQVLIGALQSVYQLVQGIRELRGEISTLTKSSGTELDDFTARIKGIATTFQADEKQIIESANAVSKAFNITFGEALTRIEEGFVAGSNANGEFLDTIREYPRLFQEAGLNADQFFKVANRQATEGIFSDKGADAVKEAALSLRELTPATLLALKGIGISGAEIQKIIGEKGIGGAIAEVAKQLDTVQENGPKAGAVLADVFRGAGEDAGIKFIKSLKDVDQATLSLIDTTNEYQTAQLRTLEINTEFNRKLVEVSEAIGGAGANLSDVTTIIQTKLLEVLLLVIQGVQDLGAILGPLSTSISELGASLGVVEENGEGAASGFNAFLKVAALAQKPFEFLVATVNGLIKGFTFLGKSVTSFYETLFSPLDRSTKTAAGSLKTFLDAAKNSKGEVLQFGAGSEEASKKVDKITTSVNKAKKVAEEFGKGSLAFLRGEVSKLEREIERASPRDQPALFERLFSAKNQLNKAEKEQKALLDNLTGFVEAVKEVQDVSEKTFQRAQTVTEDGVLKQVKQTEKGLRVVGSGLIERLAGLGLEISQASTKFTREATDKIRTDFQVSFDAAIESIEEFFKSGQIFRTISEAGAAISGIASARNESELNAIEERYAKEIELAGDNTKKKEKLEKELAAEQERIRKKEFEQQKRYRIAAALASLAEGTVNILSSPSTIPDPFGTLFKLGQIAFLTFTTTSQIAQISAQKAARGMIIKGASHAHGGVPVQVGGQVIEAEGGEWMGDDGQGGTAIINKHNTGRYYPILKQLSAVNFPGKRTVLSAINADRGYGVKFEQGGLLEPNFSKMNVGVSGGGISIVSIDANSIQNMAAAVGVGAKRGVEAGLVVANRENERIAKAEEKSKI